MEVVARMLAVPPGLRASADELLALPFFSSAFQHGRLACRKRNGLEPQPQSRVEQSDMRADRNDVQAKTSVIPPDMAFSILQVMQERERHAQSPTVLSLHDLDSQERVETVNFLVGLASSLSLNDYTIHLAVALLDRALALEELVSPEERRVIGATCLKAADIFAEQSKEYYKQENTTEYCEAMLHEVTPSQLLRREKELLPRIRFDLWHPTSHWFLQCFLTYGGFNRANPVAKTALFISDLTLLDGDMQRYRPSLRAQCALVLAAFMRSNTRGEDGGTGNQTSAQAPGDGAASSSIVSVLAAWEAVRDRACLDNTPVDVAMCLQRTVHVLVVRRREWKTARITAMEVKHAGLAMVLAYPEVFPVPQLVRHILPNRCLPLS